MKTIKFNCRGNNAPAYGCNKPGDNTGEYVSAEVANDLYEALSGYVQMMAVGGGNDPEAIKKAIREADNAARAALAKARGES